MEDQEQPRPPIYNPEDYAMFLKKWARSNSDLNGTSNAGSNADYSSSSSSENNTGLLKMTTIAENGEMSLRQFSSVTDLLSKLKNDLQLAYSSFVQEFVADPIDGVCLLLDLLRSIQQTQNTIQSKGRPAAHRRSLLDEHSCLLCLRYCLRSQDAPRKMSLSSTGLFTLAKCIMSSVGKIRIIALELLTKTCSCNGCKNQSHNAISEAISAMRLQFGEPVRFQFLVGMLTGATPDLLLAGLQFINTFLETSPNKQIQLYVQIELQQAGFDVQMIKKVMPVKDQLNDNNITEELNRWSALYIDIEKLQINYDHKCKEVTLLKDKIRQLQYKVKMLQEENESLTITSASMKRRQSELESQLSDLKLTSSTNENNNEIAGVNSVKYEKLENSKNDPIDPQTLYGIKYTVPQIDDKTVPSSSPNCDQHNLEKNPNYCNSSNFENNVDDINKKRISSNNYGKITNTEDILLMNGYSTIEEQLLDEECDIIPSCILPQPPRRSRNLFISDKHFEKNLFYDEDDESFENSNSTCISDESCPDKMNIEFQISDTSVKDKELILNKPENQVRSQLNNHIRRSKTFHHAQQTTEFSFESFDNSEPNETHRCRRKDRYRNNSYKSANEKNPNNAPTRTVGRLRRDLSERKITNALQPDYQSPTGIRLSRSLSTKQTTSSDSSKIPFTSKSNENIFSNFPNTFKQLIGGGSNGNNQFSLKRNNNNAGLYSGRNNVSESSAHLNRVTTIASAYPNRCLNGLKHINLNSVNTDRIVDLPSGLY